MNATEIKGSDTMVEYSIEYYGKTYNVVIESNNVYVKNNMKKIRIDDILISRHMVGSGKVLVFGPFKVYATILEDEDFQLMMSQFGGASKKSKLSSIVKWINTGKTTKGKDGKVSVAYQNSRTRQVCVKRKQVDGSFKYVK